MTTWQAELHKRLKTMCRHASQYMIKDTPPKWFKALALPKPEKNVEPGDDADGDQHEDEFDEKNDEEGGEEEDPADFEPDVEVDTGAAKTPMYDYGYDGEARCAFRTRTDGPKKHFPEYAVEMREPPDAAPTDCMLAVFKG
eukprot:6805034-Pyramimonas_sp.AAC.1